MCIKRPLDGKNLKIDHVDTCDSIEVTGFSQKTTKDSLLYYFENSRNKGGDLRQLEYVEGEARAVVFFEDPSVVDNIMTQTHVIDGANLVINRHYAFLGDISSTNPGAIKKDKVIKVNPQSMLFIKEFLSQEFDQILQENRVTYTWEEHSGEIVLGCTEPRMDKKTWEKSCEAVVAYINNIVSEKLVISLELWEQMSKEAKEKCAAFANRVSIKQILDFKGENEHSILLSGKKEYVFNLMEQLQSLVSRMEEQIKIEKSKIAKNIELSDLKMNLLSLSGFIDGLKTNYESLDITVKSDSSFQVIQLRGLDEDVNNCTAFIWQTLSEVKESEMSISKQVASILASREGKHFIATGFKENSVEATITFESKSDHDPVLLVTAMDRKNMNTAVEFIKNAVAEERIPIDVDKNRLNESEKWNELKRSLQQSMLLQVTEKPSTSTLLLVGIRKEVERAKEKVERFFQDNAVSLKAIESRSIDLTKAQLDLLSISGFVEDLQARASNLEVKLSKNDGTIYLRGPDAVVKEGSITVWQSLAKVKELDMELPRSVIDVVDSQPGQQFIAAKLKKENIDAVVNRDPSSENQLIVTAVDRKDAKKAIGLIKDLTSEQSIPLDDHQKQLIKCKKWKELKHSIQQNMLVQAREEPAASTLWIAGIKEEVDYAKERVDDFFQENIILDKVIYAENGRMKFVFRFRKDAIRSMERSLSNQSVKITKKADKDGEVSAIVVSGTRDGIQQAVRLVQKLIEEIKERKVNWEKPGMKKFFSEKKGMTLLSIVEITMTV